MGVRMIGYAPSSFAYSLDQLLTLAELEHDVWSLSGASNWLRGSALIFKRFIDLWAKCKALKLDDYIGGESIGSQTHPPLL